MIALGKQLTGNSHHGVDEHQFINPTIDQKKKKNLTTPHHQNKFTGQHSQFTTTAECIPKKFHSYSHEACRRKKA